MVIGISIAKDKTVCVFDSLEALGQYLEPWYFAEEGARVFDVDGYEYDVVLGRKSLVSFVRAATPDSHADLLRDRIVDRAELTGAETLSDAVEQFVSRFGYCCI